MKKSIFEGEYGKKIKLLGIALITLIVVSVISLLLTMIVGTTGASGNIGAIIGFVWISTTILTIVMLSITIHKSFILNGEMPNKKFNVIGIIASVLLGLFMIFILLAIIALFDKKQGVASGHRGISVLGIVLNVVSYTLAITFYSVSLWWILKQKTNKNVIDNDQEQVIEPNTNQE